MALAVFLSTITLYGLTLAPTITQRHFGSDGAELTTAAYTLGIAHPSGYPTYLLLAKLFSLLAPWGDIALRVNLFSAFAGAGAAVLVYYTTHLLIEKALTRHEIGRPTATSASFIAATSFAIAPLFWSQSIVAEVYSLNALLTTGIALLALVWSLQPDAGDRPFLAAALLLGLGLGNHLTVAFLAMPMGYLLWLRSDRLTRGLLSKAAGLLVLGLAVYLYLPIRASQNPPINWGDTASLEGFWWMVSAKPYRELAFGLPLSELPGRIAEWATLLVQQFNWVGFPVALIGVWRLRVSSTPLLVTTSLLFLTSVVYSIMYFTPDARVYLIPAIMVLAWWVGLGFAWVAVRVEHLVSDRTGLASAAPIALLLGALLAIPGLGLLLNYQDTSLRGDKVTLAYAQGIFGQVERGALVLADAESELFPLWYYRYVEMDGTGPTVLSTRLTQFDWYLRDQHDRYPEVVPAQVPGAFADRLRNLVEYNLPRRPVYITLNADYLLRQFDGERRGDLYVLSARSP